MVAASLSKGQEVFVFGQKKTCSIVSTNKKISDQKERLYRVDLVHVLPAGSQHPFTKQISKKCCQSPFDPRKDRECAQHPKLLHRDLNVDASLWFVDGTLASNELHL